MLVSRTFTERVCWSDWNQPSFSKYHQVLKVTDSISTVNTYILFKSMQELLNNLSGQCVTNDWNNILFVSLFTTLHVWPQFRFKILLKWNNFKIRMTLLKWYIVCYYNELKDGSPDIHKIGENQQRLQTSFLYLKHNVTIEQIFHLPKFIVFYNL